MMGMTHRYLPDGALQITNDDGSRIWCHQYWVQAMLGTLGDIDFQKKPQSPFWTNQHMRNSGVQKAGPYLTIDEINRFVLPVLKESSSV